VGRDTPAVRAICAFGIPSAASSTIRARFASPDGTLGSQASSASRSRSPGPSIAGAGKRIDALMRTADRIHSMIFAEFKRHDAHLLHKKHRPGCWSPSEDLAGGVAQTQGTVYRAVRDIGQRLADTAPDGSELPGQFTYLIRPRSFLIIGQLADLEGESGGDHLDRIRSFELYRRQLTEPEVVTYDELLARAEWFVTTSADAD
jgi:hypothetical protein